MDQEFVYFISHDHGPIKIGKARDVKKRLSSLQTSCPHRLSVLGIMPSDGSLEGKLHRQFSTLRMRGEWFRRDARLLDFIKESSQPFGDPNYQCSSMIRLIDPVTGPFGPVQVISGDHAGQYGYYDDDHLEHETECDFCAEATERGVDLGDYECEECVYVNYAVVYLGSFLGGEIEYFNYSELRVVEDDSTHDEIARTLWPQQTETQLEIELPELNL